MAAPAVPIAAPTIPIVPILVSSLDLEDSNDLALALPQPVELRKQVTMADSAKDHDTSLTLAQAVMLPNDIADLAMKGSKEIQDLLIMQQVQKEFAISKSIKEQSSELKKSKKKISSLKKQTKLDSVAVEQMKLDLAIAIQERDASYAAVIEARGEVTVVQEQLNKALGDLSKLEKVACSSVYERVFNWGLTELGITMTSNCPN
ncbi:hypothetical protein Acr_23g0016210 [Actinidia rufa]|uniref:Uncharacterized protein n=1 Tax=Actinidia rufa TaxID=165716 RepID=A0A7J0GR03_9ERIC|nr:hypothetical protein Acr_23g0016210 [Actinidia rufa]